MSVTERHDHATQPSTLSWGLIWLTIAALSAAIFFIDGLDALRVAWALPEYSHGPLIPILSGLLFLRQLREYPIDLGPKRNRWVGVTILLGAFIFGALGRLSGISDLVAYATILWVWGILLVSFGWSTGKHFWPPVLHLVYMLPLPGVLYYKLTGSLQLISSELGVWFLQLANVPVFLEGNIIDLGVMRLHVAEACSGLRYLFPIMSFSYIFAVLYRGPIWHKAVLLLAAVPITIFMNSVRIAIAGVIANRYGVEWLEGFTHFFEGWIIFIACIVLLFLLAWTMLLLLPKDQKMTLPQALDLETDGLWTQFKRIALVQPSAAMIASASLGLAALVAWQAAPDNRQGTVDRETFLLFPRSFETWEQIGPRQQLDDAIAIVLAADDYHSVNFHRPGQAGTVGLFIAWYEDQTQGGVHSPEVCLPGSGWEIAWLERSDISAQTGIDSPFNINRAIIQRGETRMMAYYWFQQGERRVAWDFAAKFYLMLDGIRSGSTDGALVRMLTLIDEGETEMEAEARLLSMLREMEPSMPRFLPED